MSKSYLDNSGLEYLFNNYIINKTIGTTKGDLLYVSAAKTDTTPVVYSRLGIGNNNQVLSVSNGIPTWRNESTVSVSMNYTSSLNLGTINSIAVYVPIAGSSQLGVIKTGGTYTTAKRYAVNTGAGGDAYVDVPWQNTTYSGQLQYFNSGSTNAFMIYQPDTTRQFRLAEGLTFNSTTGSSTTDITLSVNTITTAEIDSMFS